MIITLSLWEEPKQWGMKYFLNTQFLGLDFSVVASPLPSGIVTASFQLHLGSQSQRMMELCCSEALSTYCSDSPWSHCRKLWKEALDLSLHQKREEPWTSTGISTHSGWRASPLLMGRKESVWRFKKASVHYQIPAGFYDNFYNFFIHKSGCFEG